MFKYNLIPLHPLPQNNKKNIAAIYVYHVGYNQKLLVLVTFKPHFPKNKSR